MRLVAGCAAIVLVLLALVPGEAGAQGPGLFIDIQPPAGPPGTTVTITGRGAPPGEVVRVRFAPFPTTAPCSPPRAPELVAEVRANTDGTFIATHLARQLNPEQAGNVYLADLGNIPDQPAPGSDTECFQFQAVPGNEGRFFPETGHSVRGRFLDYWVHNGGLYIFGYPLTNERQEQGRTVQYFERARLERWPENLPPYDVQLGRLGVEALQQRGIDWAQQPTSPGPAPGCLYFPETNHNVCNQQRGIGFLNTWRSNGLSFDGRPGSSYGESLALFGYPITEPYQYTFPDGRTLQVQWFERARLEWHPDNPAQYRVLLGRLGAEVLAGQAATLSPPVSDVAPQRLLDRIVADLAQRLRVAPGAVRVIDSEAVDWPSEAIGCPAPDRFYAEVITPGYRITLEAQGRRFNYHTAADERFVLCAEDP